MVDEQFISSPLHRKIVLAIDTGPVAKEYQTPIIEEHNNQFRVTLYSKRIAIRQSSKWEQALINYLKLNPSITPKDAAKLWQVTSRTARTRLKALLELGLLQRIATSENDPFATFIIGK